MSEEREQLPLDAKLLSLAIIELNISRRNVAIYPEDHPLIKQAIGKAFAHLQSLFEIRNEITLAVAKDVLIIDDYFLEKKNPVYRDFASALFAMGIASVSFISGVTEDEITLFHRVLTLDPEEIRAKGGINALVEEMGITHIRPQSVDYSAFHFSEGETRKEDQTNVWEDYTYGLLRGQLITDEDAAKIRGIPPEMFARIVNRTMNNDAGQEAYDNVITAYLKKSSEERRLRKGSLGDLSAFISGLKPALKKQFLSGTFRFLSPDPMLAKTISEQFTSDQLMDLLREINERDEIIPETLRTIMEKFASIGQKEFVMDTKLVPSGGSLFDDIQLDPEMARLFQKDRYDDFVSADYKKELQIIMGRDVQGATGSVVREVQKECEDELLDSYTTAVCFELLDREGMLSEEELEKVSNYLKRNSRMFVETGQFHELVKIHDFSKTLVDRPAYASVSREVFEEMRSELFILQFLSFLRFWGRKNREDAIELSKRLSKSLTEPLFQALIEEENSSLRGFYLSILSSFGQDVVPLALSYLDDERWFVRRNMLIILRECGDRRVLKNIKPFCENPDFRVALEAIKAFMYFGDNDGLRYMKRFLLSKDLQVRDQILKIAGSYRLKILVSDIIKLLISKDIIGGDFHLKIPIVKALGDVGDPRALPYLLEICKSKSLLYRKSLDLLKVEIYRSLSKYLPNDIGQFIDIGMKSGHDEIIVLCVQLREQKGHDGSE